MKDIVIWIIITGTMLLLFVLILFIAIVQKNKRLAVWSVLPVLIGVAAGGITIYKMISKSYHTIKHADLNNPFKARTGKEIYTTLFKKPENDCLTVTNKKDQYVPGLDCCIWLEFSTCPQELERVIQQEKYDVQKTNSAFVSISGDNEKPYWWKPTQSGDSIFFLQHNYDGRRLQQLLFSKDSTKVLYCDMLY